jgi:hypothetical protein
VTRSLARLFRARTSAVDLDTEGGRAFLQERIALFNRVAFWISAFFFAAALLGSPYYRSATPVLLHAATLAVSLAAWQACRQAAAIPLGVLAEVDAASVVLVIALFAAQALLLPPAFAGEVAHSLVLVFTHAVVIRAVIVPSSAIRTTVVCFLASLPAAAAIGWLPVPPGAGPTVVVVNDRFWSWLWTACAIVVSSLVSSVIYGLRAEVQKALRLGQYTLEEKLGEGGMGTVYRARHALLRRPTAIKLLPPEKAGAAAIARFEREVQLTAELSHPNTVSVFDYGRTHDGIFYYAMEYLEGTNLAGLVRDDGPQPPARVVSVLRQVASALVEAHGVGLIHRDVKPENVILCERGGVPDVAKVVDFGLVRDLAPGSGARLTQSNVIQGTPLYLSPEAIRTPDAVDARSDIYGLGAVGYYLLTGTHLFGGATAIEICGHHLHSQPEPPSQRLGRPLPASLQGLILACVEKDPERRPASAAALRDELEGLADLGSWGEREAREWWDRWRRIHAPRSGFGSGGETRREARTGRG